MESNQIKMEQAVNDIVRKKVIKLENELSNMRHELHAIESNSYPKTFGLSKAENSKIKNRPVCLRKRIDKFNAELQLLEMFLSTKPITHCSCIADAPPAYNAN